MKLPHDPAIPLLGIYPEETKTERDTCIPLFIAPLFTVARTWKQPRCPLTDEWIKLWHIYTMENKKKKYCGALRGRMEGTLILSDHSVLSKRKEKCENS